MTDRSSHIGGNNSGVIVTGEGNAVHFHSLGSMSAEQHLEAGTERLRSRLYKEAMEDFKVAMMEQPQKSQALFMSAVAMLGGRKAFLTPLANIQKAEEFLGAALLVEDRGIFHYFLAYLRLDFYERKSLSSRSPWQSSIDQAWRCGIDNDDIDALFSMLQTNNPLPARQ